MRIFMTIIGPMVEMEDRKIVPFTSPEYYGNPAVWWADSWAEFYDVMGIFKKHSDAEIYL